MFIFQFIGEFLKLFGATLIWIYQRLKGNKFNFKAYVWKEGLPMDGWSQMMIGFSFFLVVGLIIVKIV